MKEHSGTLIANHRHAVTHEISIIEYSLRGHWTCVRMRLIARDSCCNVNDGARARALFKDHENLWRLTK